MKSYSAIIRCIGPKSKGAEKIPRLYTSILVGNYPDQPDGFPLIVGGGGVRNGNDLSDPVLGNERVYRIVQRLQLVHSFQRTDFHTERLDLDRHKTPPCSYNVGARLPRPGRGNPAPTTDQTETTSLTPGTLSFRVFSIPILRVMVDIGQWPQAPTSLTLTTPSSLTSTSSTSPPSACSAGRIISSTFLTSSIIVVSFLSISIMLPRAHAMSPYKFPFTIHHSLSFPGHPRVCQGIRFQDLRQRLRGKEFPCQNDLPDAPAGPHRFLRHFGRRPVADIGSKDRDQPERLLHEPVTPGLVGGYPGNARLGKLAHGIFQDLQGEEEIVSDHRHHHVQLELACLG